MDDISDKVDLLVADSRLAFLQGRYDIALNLAKQALEIDFKNADAQQCAGNAYMSVEKYEKAIKHYKKAIDFDSDNGDRYFNLGYAYATDNQAADALWIGAELVDNNGKILRVEQIYREISIIERLKI